MSAKVHNSDIAAAAETEVEFAKCDCCGLTEECTPGYIAGIRARYDGRWICGLCSEAVKDEIVRSERRITTGEALDRHRSFRELPPRAPQKKDQLICAMRQLLRRSLESPRAMRGMRSMPSSPRRDGEESGEGGSGVLTRSGSCFSTIGRE